MSFKPKLQINTNCNCAFTQGSRDEALEGGVEYDGVPASSFLLESARD